MTYTDPDVLAYIGIKGLLSVIFSSNFDEDFKYLHTMLSVDTPNTLMILKELVLRYQHMFDGEMKNNVLQIVEYFRGPYLKKHPDDKSIIYTLANEVIVNINCADNTMLKDFVNKQLRIRYYYSNIFQLNHLQYDLAVPYLKINNVDDFYILCVHSDLCTEEDFLASMPSLADLDSDYIANISAIMTEFPAILKDPTFLRRVMMVTKKLGKNIDKSDGEELDMPLKYMKKIYKRYLKNMKKYIN